MSKRWAIWCLLIMLALCLVSIPKPAVALSIDDYFSYSLDTEFSRDELGEDEVFYATVDGTAICKQDLPLTVSNGYITSRIVAQHRGSDTEVTLKSRYTTTIEPFPNEKGEVTEERVVISLKFPHGSQPGTYDIVGELIEARVQSIFGFWFTVTPYLPSSEDMGSVFYIPEEEDEDVPLIGPIFELSSYMDNGVFTGDFVFQSDDDRCQLIISEDTLCLTEDGEPLGELIMFEMADPPAPPEGYEVVGFIYNLGPDRATFDPPIILTLTYSGLSMPVGVAEGDLVVAMWEELGDEWVILGGSTVDSGVNAITVPISHFSAFAILAPALVLSPADFTVTGLAVTPEEANIGEEITISVLVTNSGDLEGTYRVELKIDGGLEGTGNICLAGGKSWPVDFTIRKDVAGTYIVNVNGLLGTFEVMAAYPAPSTTPVAPPPEPQAPPVTPPAPTNWWLVGSIIAAVAAGITLPVLLRWRRRDS